VFLSFCVLHLSISYYIVPSIFCILRVRSLKINPSQQQTLLKNQNHKLFSLAHTITNIIEKQPNNFLFEESKNFVLPFISKQDQLVLLLACYNKSFKNNKITPICASF
jgi:hypothetical protein